MKRAWLITIIICLVLLGGGGAVLLLPQVVPFDQCSDLYKQYANVEGIDATFILSVLYRYPQYRFQCADNT